MLKRLPIIGILLALLAFMIPIEHKYDKLFRFYSLTLIPEGLTLTRGYEKKLYFYLSDLLALALLFIGLRKKLFANSLWIVWIAAFLSIVASPFAHYPVAYTRLLQLFTPIALFSLISTEEERVKITSYFLWAIVAAGLIQTAIAIPQYFHQAPLGLRLFGETNATTGFTIDDGSRWLFDFQRRDNPLIMRAAGTFPHANVFGGFMVLSLLATYLLSLRKKGLLLTIPFQLFALSLSYSRSALFAWVIATLLWFAMMFKEQASKRLKLTLILSFACVSTLLYNQYLHRGGVISYPALAQDSDNIRKFHQATALDIIKDNPLFGLGFSQFSEGALRYFPAEIQPYVRSTAPHNIFLFLACETGLIALLALFFWICKLLLSFLKAPRTPETATFASLFIAFLWIGCCDFYPLLFQQGKLMFFLSAAFLALHTQKKLSLPSKQQSWQIFDRISHSYDRVNRIISLGMDQRWRGRVAAFLPPHQNLRILDLATGTGDQALALLQSSASIESITGIDLSTEMLAIAKQKIPAKTTFLHADAQKLPLSSLSFDAVTFSFGIRNVPNPLLSLQEIHRVLKPKGKALILEFSLPARPIRPFFLFYLRHILPRIAGIISRDFPAYRYLNQTIEHFPSGKAFSALMQEAGFTHLQRVPMNLGSVTLYIGQKE